jgi:hypothetical protein
MSYFPILIPSTLGKNQSVQLPKISTLENYTHLTKDEFEMHFRKNLNGQHIGLFTAASLISKFYNFDNLKESDKFDVIEFVENDEYGTVKYFFKKLFKIK